MIYIDLFNNPPSQELIDKGKDLTKELLKLSPDKRGEFIDKHASYWGELKEHYMALSYGKCWYTEAKEIASSYHMDHFRPKKEVKHLKKDCGIETSNNDEAYWWLAFDWRNYRLSSSVPNTRKGTYFPLLKGTKAAKKEDELYNEMIGLLDPTDEYDVSLIAFGMDGKVYPACTNANNWDVQRVSLSKRIYNLDYPPLVDARIEIQNICKARIAKIKRAQRIYTQNSTLDAREELKDRVRELKEMVKPTAELSAVARNYIRNDTEEFIRNIAS